MAVEAGFALGDGVFDTPLPGVPLSDPRECPGQECEAGLVAWQARLVYVEWRRACWMLETARARADVTERWPEPDLGRTRPPDEAGSRRRPGPPRRGAPGP